MFGYDCCPQGDNFYLYKIHKLLITRTIVNSKESERYYNTGSSFCICKWNDECVLSLDVQAFTVITTYIPYVNV